MPDQPFPVDGTVLDINNSPMENAIVEIHNLRNGDVIKEENATDSNGAYIIDLENNPTFKYADKDRIIIRAYKSGGIFKFGERHAVLGAGARVLESQDITLFAENPKTAWDKELQQIHLNEHHPTANAKKIILVDEEGNLTTVAALDKQWAYVSGTGRPEYVGDAKAGAKDTDPAWRIKKRFYDTSNKFIKSRYADKGRFTQKWSAREGITYGP